MVRKVNMKNDTWVKSVKHIITRKLKVSHDLNKTITVDKILTVGEDYLLRKFPGNNHIRDSVIHALHRLVRIGYLTQQSNTDFKINMSWKKPKTYLLTKRGKWILGDMVLQQIDDSIYANYKGNLVRLGDAV